MRSGRMWPCLSTLCLLTLVLGSTASAETGGISVRIVPGGTFAAKKVTGSYEGLGAAFGDVVGWLGKNADSVTVAGPAQSVFRDDPKALPAEKLRSEAWIPIRIDPAKPAPVEGDGVFIHREPPRLVMRAVHHGPAAAVESTFANLIRAVPGKGLKFAWPIWQVYLTDLTKTPPADQRVEARISVEPTGPTDVGIYVGRGAYPEFLPAISEAVGGGGLTIRPIDAEAILDGKLGKRCRALLMPGGWAGSYVEDLGPAGAKRIGEFVAKGNGYIGICAGAYFAAKRIEWEGKPLAYPLDLFPGVPTGPVKEIAAWPGFALTKVVIDPAHPITKGFPKERTVLYYGGPVLTPKRGAKVKVIARYGGKGGGKDGDPAIVAFSRGRGRVFLTAVHLEMCLGRDREEYGWPAAEVEKPDPEPDRDLLRRGTEWVLRR